MTNVFDYIDRKPNSVDEAQAELLALARQVLLIQLRVVYLEAFIRNQPADTELPDQNFSGRF